MDARSRLRALLELPHDGDEQAPPRAPTDDPARAVLDASRWMTEALDRTMIRAIATSTAVELVGADEGGWAVGDRTGARWVPSVPAWATTDPLDDRAVAAALACGSAVALAADDADRRLAAVPVRVDGAVVGVIAVARHTPGPLAPDATERLAMLVPVVGAALAGADALVGAVTAAEVDALTGLRNRRRLDADLSALGSPDRVACAMVDVDHFKTFNDTNGHEGGDTALAMVAAAIEGALRPGDAAYRYGGEEFCVVLRDCDGPEAVAAMERVRIAVRALDVPGMAAQPGGRVTVSIGVAGSASTAPEDLLGRADEALYAAKSAGRDRVVPALG